MTETGKKRLSNFIKLHEIKQIKFKTKFNISVFTFCEVRVNIKYMFSK